MRSPPRSALLGTLAALGALLMLWWQWGAMSDFLQDRRDAENASPTLSALFSREVLLVRKGQEACLEPVTFYADTGKVRVRLRAPKAPAPKVDLRMRGGGYSETVPIPPPQPQVEGTATVEFPRANREVTGDFCFVNRGPTPIQLIGTNEGRSQTPVELSLDGKPIRGAELELVLFKAGHHSLGSRRAELVDRAATFTGGLVPTWVLWPIALLLFALPLIVAALIGAEVWRGERVSRDPAGPPAGDPS